MFQPVEFYCENWLKWVGNEGKKTGENFTDFQSHLHQLAVAKENFQISFERYFITSDFKFVYHLKFNEFTKFME